MSSSTRSLDVTGYFDRKTEAILRRYGPGPRVHYHAGLIEEAPPARASAEQLRACLIEGQEQLLYFAADAWDAARTLRGEVLDVGCGLGGGAIFWAEEFGARVNAVTNVAGHAPLVARFAAESGVAARVQPVLADAATLPGEGRFDAAVAVDSSGYLPRRPWFRRLAALLRPGGHAFIVDCFLGRPDYAAPFDRHWHTRIGTLDEYAGAAAAAGLAAGPVEDISHRTEHFWTTTLALTEIEARAPEESPGDAMRRQISRDAHALVRRGLADGGLRYAVMSFRKQV